MQPKTFLYLLALARLFLPFLLQDPVYQPHRDEFLYLEQGKHLDWGYLEVPPLLSLFAALVNAMGASLFWIKLFPALFAALTYLLAGKMVLQLGGGKFALFMAWCPLFFQGYLRMFFLFQPNFLEVFFWTAMGFSLLQYKLLEKSKWLYFFGLAAGLGLMSKYSAAFYLFSLLFALLLTFRRIFLNKHLYFAALLALIIVLPNIIWQVNHNFPLIRHMEELKATQLQFVAPTDFLLSQLLMNLPCIYIVVAAFVYSFSRQGNRCTFIPLALLLVIGLLVAMKGKDYYAMAAYPPVYALGAVAIEKYTAARLRFTRYVATVYTVVLGLFLLPLLMPLWKPQKLAAYYEQIGINKTGSFKWEDLRYHSLPQDFADMVGWREIAEKTAKVYLSLPQEERLRTLVYCRGYFTAGALNYYAKELGLPVVHSDNASFLLWMPEKYNINNLLLVGHSIPGQDDEVFQQFGSWNIADSLNYPLARENGIRIFLYRNGNEHVNGMIEQGIKQMKAEFNQN